MQRETFCFPGRGWRTSPPSELSYNSGSGFLEPAENLHFIASIEILVLSMKKISMKTP